MSFPKFVYMTKNTPFFPILHVFALLNDVPTYIAWSWKTTLITWIFGRAWYSPWHSSAPPPPPRIDLNPTLPDCWFWRLCCLSSLLWYCLAETGPLHLKSTLRQGLTFISISENHIWFSQDHFARINWFSYEKQWKILNFKSKVHQICWWDDEYGDWSYFKCQLCCFLFDFLYKYTTDIPSKRTIILRGYCTSGPYFLRLCIFSKNKATSDKVSYGSGQKCSKEFKNYSFTSLETIVVKLQ